MSHVEPPYLRIDTWDASPPEQYLARSGNCSFDFRMLIRGLPPVHLEMVIGVEWAGQCAHIDCWQITTDIRLITRACCVPLRSSCEGALQIASECSLRIFVVAAYLLMLYFYAH
eukprot:6188429-Pleurochrysis_carterae.AAC.2